MDNIKYPYKDLLIYFIIILIILVSYTSSI